MVNRQHGTPSHNPSNGITDTVVTNEGFQILHRNTAHRLEKMMVNKSGKLKMHCFETNNELECEPKLADCFCEF